MIAKRVCNISPFPSVYQVEGKKSLFPINQKRQGKNMKKLLTLGMAAVMAVSAAVCVQTNVGNRTTVVAEAVKTGTNKNAAFMDTLENMEGGWVKAESPELTPHVKERFDKAMTELVGVSYAPMELLATQTVAGTNYAILCKAQVVVPDAEEYEAVVYIYEDLEGNATVSDIVDARQ